MRVSQAHPARQQPIPADTGLLDGVGPLDGAHALVVGPGALEAICGLIRHGCTAAVELPACGRLAPEPHAADAVIVPEVATLGEARRAIELATRALTLGGRIALRDAAGGLADGIAGLLRAHGFGAVRARATDAGTVLTAERPMFGPLHRR